jgi:hypothetical protein
MWQDYVMSGTAVLFGYSLVPQVTYGFKTRKRTVTRQTGVMTTLGIATLAYTEHSLGLTFAPVMSAITAGLWGTLTYQSFAYPEIREDAETSPLENILRETSAVIEGTGTDASSTP